jgi:RNA polymerase sigma-70 factor, ECF subfamily
MTSETEIEWALARAAARGDMVAFERLHVRTAPRVRRLVGWLVEPDLVDDVVQDTMIAVWRGLPRFQGAAALQTWMHRIATREAMRVRRRRGRDWDREQPLELVDAQAAEGIEPLDAMALEAALLRLPPTARAVFVLTCIEGNTHEEVAEMMAINAATSRSHLRHARARLRSLLELEAE